MQKHHCLLKRALTKTAALGNHEKTSKCKRSNSSNLHLCNNTELTGGIVKED